MNRSMDMKNRTRVLHKYVYLNFLIGVLILVLLCDCAGTTKTVSTNHPTLDQQLGLLVSQIIEGLDQTEATKIAVIPFADLDNKESKLGRYIAEELTTKLYQTSRFEIVERTLLEKVIDEQKLGTTGFIDDNTAVSLGQILGVDAIATGTLTNLGSTIKVNARLLETVSGKVFSAASVTLYKDAALLALLGEAPSNISKPTIKQKTFKARWMQFSFELVSAELEGEILTCHFKITNTSKQDADLRIAGTGRGSSTEISTHVYDAAGNQLKDVYLRYGDEGFKQLNGFPGLIDRNILAGMTIPMDMQVYGVSGDTIELPSVQMLVGAYPGYKIIFKNVPVQIDN